MHNALIVVAILASCGVATAIAGMDRNATLADRVTFRPVRYYDAVARLNRWSWIACHASAVLAVALISLLCGA